MLEKGKKIQKKGRGRGPLVKKTSQTKFSIASKLTEKL